MRKKIKILALVLSCVLSIGTTNLSAQDLVITEIMYNPAESGTDSTEFIEIYNKGTVPVNMTGFTLTGGIYTFPNVTIPANGYYVVAIAPSGTGFFTTYGFLPDGFFSNPLTNAGESVVLKDAAGVVLDSVRYFNAAPWPATTANGGGASIVLCDVNSDNNIGSNWSIETVPVGVVLNGLAVLATPKMANGCSSSSLPLRWLNVNGNLNSSKQPVISFKVDEINVANYSIEKSTDGSMFYSIGNISSNGNGTNNYTFTDVQALNGITYYRVKQIDIDGRFSYSTIIKFSITNSSFSNSIYPNPVKDVFTLSIDKKLLNTPVVILNATGSVLKQFNITQAQTQIDISNLSSGIYLLKTINGTPQKIIKE